MLQVSSALDISAIGAGGDVARRGLTAMTRPADSLGSATPKSPIRTATKVAARDDAALVRPGATYR
jgi:hypothetical protein